MGRELLVLDVSAPYTLTRREVPNPALPPATVLDIACGDLNSDGLPDAVLGFGIYSSERTENLGFPDYVLMNLGHGRFEIGKMEPAQEGFTQGIVLADMDADGRADVIGRGGREQPWSGLSPPVAVLSSYRSKDPNRQVGACIVNPTKRIVGIGYNGFPVGCGDDALPWGRGTPGGSSLDTKYPYVCHAEMNAIMNKNCESLDGCKMYVTLFPCNECAKLIIQSRVTEVVYCSDRYHATESMTASRRMLSLANVTATPDTLESDVKAVLTKVLRILAAEYARGPQERLFIQHFTAVIPGRDPRESDRVVSARRSLPARICTGQYI